jgi:hypothetical protein
MAIERNLYSKLRELEYRRQMGQSTTVGRSEDGGDRRVIALVRVAHQREAETAEASLVNT